MNDYNSETFFNYAESGNCKGIKKLIDNGFDINCTDSIGMNALCMTIFHKKMEAAKLLIDNGIDLNSMSFTGSTPLLYSIIYKRKQFCKLLLDSGADSDYYHKNSETPLINAINTERRCLEIITLLIEKTKNINAIGLRGKTALHEAAGRDLRDISKMLINKGASIYIKDEKGRTPMQTLKFFHQGATETLDLLEDCEMIPKRINLLLCIREFIEDSLFYKDYMPIDIFKLLVKEIRLVE